MNMGGGVYGMYSQSAYNNHTGYGGYGGHPGYGCPAVQQMSYEVPMGTQAPPQPMLPPQSYTHQPYIQAQQEMNMQRYMYQQMGYQVPKIPVPQSEAKQAKQAPEKEEPSVVAFYAKERDTDLAGQDWDPEADCEYLRVAMKGAGTTESIINHIVATRCNLQRQKLKTMFKTMYGRDLVEDIRSELSGDYKDAILACFVSPAHFDAKCVKKAIYGLGTDELALIEILMTRTNQQIKEMRAVYGDVARPDQKTRATLIEDDIKGDTSGYFKKLLISAAQGNRYEIDKTKLEQAVEEIINPNGEGTGMFQVNYTKLADETKAKRDAKRLFEAGEDRWGTDEETFNLIFATRDFYQLREIYKQYVKIAQADIRHAVDSETSGSYRKGLKGVAQSVMNRPKYFAERLMKAMKGLGTDEETLIRIIASRSEIDMVQIKAEFLEMTHKTLYRYIKEDTSFNFKKILQALVGKD